MNPIPRSMSVSIPVLAGTGPGGRIEFPNKPALDNCLVTAILATTTSTAAVNTSRLANVSPADALFLMLTFFEQSEERHREIPYLSLDPLVNSGIWSETNPFEMDWEKSEGIWNGAAPVAADFCMILVIHYFLRDDLKDLDRDV